MHSLVLVCDDRMRVCCHATPCVLSTARDRCCSALFSCRSSFVAAAAIACCSPPALRSAATFTDNSTISGKETMSTARNYAAQRSRLDRSCPPFAATLLPARSSLLFPLAPLSDFGVLCARCAVRVVSCSRSAVSVPAPTICSWAILWIAAFTAWRRFCCCSHSKCDTPTASRSSEGTMSQGKLRKCMDSTTSALESMDRSMCGGQRTAQARSMRASDAAEKVLTSVCVNPSSSVLSVSAVCLHLL